MAAAALPRSAKAGHSAYHASSKAMRVHCSRAAFSKASASEPFTMQVLAEAGHRHTGRPITPAGGLTGIYGRYRENPSGARGAQAPRKGARKVDADVVYRKQLFWTTLIYPIITG